MHRTETFLARFDKSDKEILKKLSKDRGCSMADILVEALRFYRHHYYKMQDKING